MKHQRKLSKNFTIIPNEIYFNNGLSLPAKGLLGLLLMLPNDWQYTLRGLATINNCGVDCIRSAMNELIAFGYVSRTRQRDERGRQKESIYDVYDEPQPHLIQPEQAAMDFNDDETAYDTCTNTEQQIVDEQDAAQADALVTAADPSAPDYVAAHAEVQTQIDYENLVKSPFPDERIDEIAEIITDVLITTKKELIIGGERRPASMVQARYRKITSEHIWYLFQCISCITKPIKNMHAYLLTALYHLPETYYNHIMADITYHDNIGWDAC